MTIFDQFRRENSNISNFLPLKIVNFDTKIKIDNFQAFSELLVFGQKMDLSHTVMGFSRFLATKICDNPTLVIAKVIIISF